MKRVSSGGFTVIEVILFLAITGLLFAGIMAVITGTVNRTRYETAVQETLDSIQGEYSKILNVKNDREKPYVCSTSVIQESSRGTSRGRTQCSVVGRLLRTSRDAKVITAYPVYARADITSTAVRSILTDASKTENEKLLALRLSTAPDQSEQVKLEWGVSLHRPGNKSRPYVFSALIVRMPFSSSIRTYTSGNPNESIASIRGSANLSLCINSNGLAGNAPSNGVFIPRSASSISEIRFLEADKC